MHGFNNLFTMQSPCPLYSCNFCIKKAQPCSLLSWNLTLEKNWETWKLNFKKRQKNEHYPLETWNSILKNEHYFEHYFWERRKSLFLFFVEWWHVGMNFSNLITNRISVVTFLWTLLTRKLGMRMIKICKENLAWRCFYEKGRNLKCKQKRTSQ